MIEVSSTVVAVGTGGKSSNADCSCSPCKPTCSVGVINRNRHSVGKATRSISDEEIVERTQFALANEGAHVLGEGVAERSGDIDVVYNYGYGYPRWRGGPMKYAETVGLDKVAAKLTEWADGVGGIHWEPSDYLMERAADGKDFS